MLNWFRVLLFELGRKIDDLTVDFVSSTTPFLPLKSDGLPLISESFDFEHRKITFIPDGVFMIRSKEQGKSLLFFLEVDMSTESLVSKNLNSSSIEDKIKAYRYYFERQIYKRYEKKWRTKFNGFRLLFLANASDRKVKISNLVNQDSSNDFIWITDQDEMFEKGIGSKIWIRGGNTSAELKSILSTSHITHS